MKNKNDCLGEKVSSSVQIYAHSNEQIDFIISSIAKFDGICKIDIKDYDHNVGAGQLCKLLFSVECAQRPLKSKAIQELIMLMAWIARDVIEFWDIAHEKIDFEIKSCCLDRFYNPKVDGYHNFIDLEVIIDGCIYEVSATHVTTSTFSVTKDDLKRLAAMTSIKKRVLQILFAKANLDSLCRMSVGRAVWKSYEG